MSINIYKQRICKKLESLCVKLSGLSKTDDEHVKKIYSQLIIQIRLLEKYNFNCIDNVCIKKYRVINELKKNKLKQSGGGNFLVLCALSFFALFKLNNSIVIIEKSTIARSVFEPDIYSVFCNTLYQLYYNYDGRCALIQTLMSNPANQAELILARFQTAMQKQFVGDDYQVAYIHNIIPPSELLITEKELTEHGNFYVADKMNEDLDMDLKIIYGILNRASYNETINEQKIIPMLVEQTASRIMTISEKQVGYNIGDIALSFIGVPGHAETLMSRTKIVDGREKIFWGILESDAIGQISVCQSGNKIFCETPQPLFVTTVDFFDEDEKVKLTTNGWAGIILEEVDPILHLLNSLRVFDNPDFIEKRQLIVIEQPIENEDIQIQSGFSHWLIPCTNHDNIINFVSNIHEFRTTAMSLEEPTSDYKDAPPQTPEQLNAQYLKDMYPHWYKGGVKSVKMKYYTKSRKSRKSRRLTKLKKQSKRKKHV